MNVQACFSRWKASLASRMVALGGAFWLRWCVCTLLLVVALCLGGATFVMIGLGGILGCICAVMLDALSEFRTHNDAFDAITAGMALLAFAMASAALYLPENGTLVLGCFASSGLLLALILRRLDRETGMNIQVGLWMGGVVVVLLLLFFYSGPYPALVRTLAFAVAVGLYAGLLVALRSGAELGLRAAWYLALGIGVAILAGAAFHVLEVESAGGIAFAGFVVGMVACTALAPLKRVTCWITCKLDAEKDSDW